MRRLLACAALLAAPVAAQSRTAVELPPLAHFADVAYGPLAHNALDLWVPAGPGPHPVLLFFHGGGQVGDDKSIQVATPFWAGFLWRGFAVGSAEYGPGPLFTFPAPQQDAARAVQFLRCAAPLFDLDPARLACVGQSFGGMLAGIAAYGPDHADLASPDPVERQSSRPDALVNIQGLLDWRLLEPDFPGFHFGQPTVATADPLELAGASVLPVLRKLASVPPPTFSWYDEAGMGLPVPSPHAPVFGRLLDQLLAQKSGSHVLVVAPLQTGPIDLPGKQIAAWLESVLP